MSKGLQASFWERRQLLKHMVLSKLKADRKDMYFGYYWWVLDPFLLMLVYWLLVGVILDRGGHEYPLFVLCGLVPFRAVSTTLSQSTNSISGKYSIISQINFPRIYLPLADVFANYIKLLFGLLLVVAFSTKYGRMPGVHLLLLLVPFTLQFMFSAGIALFISILGVYFRDVKNMTQFIVRIWIYASPVLYAFTRIPDSWRDYMLVNPMAPLLLMYRQIIMDGTPPSADLTAIALVESVAAVAIGLFVFNRYQSRILKLL